MEKSIGKDRIFKLSNLYIILCYFLGAIILEIMQFFTLGFGAFPAYIFVDIGIIVILCGIIAICPNQVVSQIFAIAILFFQVFLNVINVTLYNVFGSILTLSMLNLGAEATTAFSFQFLDFFNIILNLLVSAVCCTSIIILPKKVKRVFVFKKTSKYAFILVFFVICQYSGILFYNLSNVSFFGKQNDEYLSLYNSLSLANESYKNFGTYGYYFKSITNKIFNIYKIDDDETLDKLKTELDNANNFYEKTEMSGKLKNYNVVNILLESFDTFAINPYFTPIMYNLATKTGVNFSNFYGRNKTNVSEGISFLGSFPNESSIYSYKKTVGISVPYALPNLISQNSENLGQTFTANYFHSYLSDFYDRNKTFNDFGFENVYGIEEIYGTMPISNFDDRIFDCDCFSKIVDKILPTDCDRFYSQIATMATHGSYDVEIPLFEEYENYVNNNYKDYCQYLIENGFYPPTDAKFESEFKTYLARTMDTDNMIKMLLEQLESRGLSDNTLIVMFADHAPYYSDLSTQIKGFSKDEYYYSENNHLPLIMFAKNLEHTDISTFCSHYDIYPTICDLLGISYNTAITQGRSVFASENERSSVFVSFICGMFNDKLYSNDIESVLYSSKDSNNVITDELLNKFQSDVMAFYTKQQFIEKVWANKLF